MLVFANGQNDNVFKEGPSVVRVVGSTDRAAVVWSENMLLQQCSHISAVTLLQTETTVRTLEKTSLMRLARDLTETSL